MIRREIKSIAELDQFAGDFLVLLSVQSTHATLVGLSGELGSGKTAFVKAVARILGIKEEVSSPTFVIAKYYPTVPKNFLWKEMVHIDLYRFENPDEIRILKWDNLNADPMRIIFVEWPERIDQLFPKNAPVISFEFVDDTTRVVSYEPNQMAKN